MNHEANVHYNDVIMTTMASQITSLTVVYSTVYADANQRKHQSSASLVFVWGIHRDRWIPRTKGQLRGKCFHLMTSSWVTQITQSFIHGLSLNFCTKLHHDNTSKLASYNVLKSWYCSRCANPCVCAISLWFWYALNITTESYWWPHFQNINTNYLRMRFFSSYADASYTTV